MPDGRALEPTRPWPTSEQATAKIVRLAVYVVASQFYLDALTPFLSLPVLTTLRVVAGTFAAVATFRFETYMTKKRRLWP